MLSKTATHVAMYEGIERGDKMAIALFNKLSQNGHRMVRRIRPVGNGYHLALTDEGIVRTGPYMPRKEKGVTV